MKTTYKDFALEIFFAILNFIIFSLDLLFDYDKFTYTWLVNSMIFLIIIIIRLLMKIVNK